ncbi:MAG: transporter, partial [Paenibacillus sp.]|nr:transporter [Paenibacillus sp.]
FLVTERLGLPKEQFQWLMAANGIAMIIGGGLVLTLAKKAAPQNLLVLGMSVSAVGILVMGLSTNLWLTLVAEFVSGLVMPCIQIGINTMILRNTEADYVGRVSGTLTPLFMGAMIITMSSAGALKKALSLVAIYEIAVVLFIVGIVVMLPLLKRSTDKTGGSNKPGEMAS